MLIRRLSVTEEANLRIASQVGFHTAYYTGPTRTVPSSSSNELSGYTLDILNTVSCALLADFDWMYTLWTGENVPEWHGFMNAAVRQRTTSSKPRTFVHLAPYEDSSTTDVNTMFTTMCRAEEYTRSLGQKYTILTNDMQLHQIALKIQRAGAGGLE